MSATIRNAPSGENTNPQDSDAFPVTGSQYMQLVTLSGYVIDNVFDSDIQFTDITTGNADSDAHGFLPKLSGDSDTWLDGLGNFTTPPGTPSSVYDSDILFSDTTANNADTDQHGFLPKLSGDSDTWLDGLGNFTTPVSFAVSVSDSDVVFSDTTAGNADSDAHGFLPKLPGDSDQFLDGSGAWVDPYLLAPDGDGSSLTGITYGVVSGNDSDTDITASELEELSDGSETTLHDHDVTGLTNWPTINYSYVSGNDAGTNITATELEELSDGSETTLHSHASSGGQYRSHATIFDSDSDNVDGWTFLTIAGGPVLLLTDLE